MENTVLLPIYDIEHTRPLASNGYICTEDTVLGIDSGAKVCAGLPGKQPIAFYADAHKGVYKAVCTTGEMASCRKDEGYIWEVDGVFEEAAVRVAAFNDTNGNLLVVTGIDVFLVDRNANLLKQMRLDQETVQEIERSPSSECLAQWSPDGKYILLLLDAVIYTFGYDLSPVSNTRVTTNRVMNSRLVRTKKYLAHESAYTDVARRVHMPDDPEVLETEQKESVLFEKQSAYKHATWHSDFHLIVGVTRDNKIHLLERSCLRFKEIQHIRERDRDRECIQENSILRVFSSGDYVYLTHREGTSIYLKVYCLKNNTVYLKASRCISSSSSTTSAASTICSTVRSIVSDKENGAGGNENVQYLYVREGVIHVGLSRKVLGFKHRRVVNRTLEEVVEVDGARILTYNLASRIAPPPIFAEYFRIPAVPAQIRCSSRGIFCVSENNGSIFCINEDKDKSQCNSSNHREGEDEAEIPTEIPDELDMFPFSLQRLGAVYLTYASNKLTMRQSQERNELFRMQNVSSIYMLRFPFDCLLVTKDTLAYAELHRVGYDETEQKVSSTCVAKTEKGNRIVFVADISVVLLTQYGTLETYYPGFMVRHRMQALAESGEIQQAVCLAQRHGEGLESISEPLLSAANSPRGLDSSLLFAATKICLAKDTPENRNCVASIREAVLKRLQCIEQQRSTESLRTMLQDLEIEPGPLEAPDASPARDTDGIEHPEEKRGSSKEVSALCNLLAEIYISNSEYAQIVSLACSHVPDALSRFSPFSFEKTETLSVAEGILRRALKTTGKELLLTLCMSAYAYPLCYLLCSITDSPVDEVNSVLLGPGTEVSEIDPGNAREEIERRYRISVLTKNKEKEVIYTLKREAQGASMEKWGEEACTELARKTIKLLETRGIRNFYEFLLHPSQDGREDACFPSEACTQIRSRVLCSAGDKLCAEQAPEEALKCYLAAQKCGREKAAALQLQLGRWEELFSDPQNITPHNIEKIEQVLHNKKNLRGAALMHMQYGCRKRGIGLLVACREYAEIRNAIEKERAEGEASYIPSILEYNRLIEHIEECRPEIDTLLRKYLEHRERLDRVRARKNAQRMDMLQGEYFDDDCNSTVCSSRSFITNTFLSGASSKKTRRPAKLRNTVNGRYEEEYVQYVLREIVLSVAFQAEQIEAIEGIFQCVGKEQEVRNAKDKWAQKVQELLLMLLPLYDSDFETRNTEDDPLYDPSRPVIQKPPLDALLEYGRAGRRTSS